MIINRIYEHQNILSL